VGADPAVPAGERSPIGIEAMVDEAPAPGLAPGALVVVPPAFVGVVEGLADELPHPASPRADADSATSDQLRRRDMEEDPFR
jgi:hypothetical protein